MERVWVFDRVAVSVARIDFLDPAVAHEPDARERGVRIEVRPLAAQHEGSIYSSPSKTLQPAICRVDFLESAPGAADRMHWHPEMEDGEPGDRTFDTTMPPDPVGWLLSFLRDGVADFLTRAGAELGERDLDAIRLASDEIGMDVGLGLVWAREPWPEVTHDERGMATT